MSAPGCPIDPDVSWALERHTSAGTERTEGSGLASGLRALWRFTMREGVDAAGQASGASAVLLLAPGKSLGPRGRVAVAVAPAGNTVLLRLRSFLETARGVLVLEQLANAHARLLLQSGRWNVADPDPAAESLAPLTIASLLDDPDSLIRALKPGH